MRHAVCCVLFPLHLLAACPQTLMLDDPLPEIDIYEPSVYEWIISKCTGCLCPPPNNDDEKDDWCDMLWRMRSLCLRRDCFNAYVTLQKILLSDVITDDEKEAMKQLYEKRFGQNSMMIFFL